jgi:hypothetical protein
MKQRNYVAKYAQRSGAGKHKENKMKDYNYDYWNDADYDSVDYSAVEQYQERIAELEQVGRAAGHRVRYGSEGSASGM